MSMQPDESRMIGLRPSPGHPCPVGHPLDEDFSPLGAWVNLQDLTREWSTLAFGLGDHLTLAPLAARAFQGIGQGFLAFSHEESAYAHYQLVANRLRYPPSVVAEGLEQTLTDLHEARVNWAAVSYWFEQLANEVSHQEKLLDLVRSAIHLVRRQQQRLSALLHALYHEHIRQQHRAQQWEQEQGWHSVGQEGAK